MKKLTKKIIAISVLGLLPALSLQVNAQSNKLVIPQYDTGTLTNAGCDPQVWTKLVTEYAAKRGMERGTELDIIEQQVLSAPDAKKPGAGGGAGSCFQAATQNINSAMQGINSLMSLFNGGFDLGALGAGIIGKLGEAACRELDTQLGGATSGLRQVTNVTSGITNTITGAGINTPLGRIPVGQAVTGGGNNPNAPQIPYIGTAGINNATAPYVNQVQGLGNQAQGVINQGAAGASSFFQKLNPFRQDAQAVPDPLK